MTGVQPDVAGDEGDAEEQDRAGHDDAADPVEAAAAAAGPPPVADDPPLEPEPVTATFRVMEVDDVSLELPSQYPAVTLIESEPPMRELVFPVGLPEGTAMVQAQRRLSGRRPMTHELFMQVLHEARIDVIAVRIVGRGEGNLLAELDLMTPTGRIQVRCRPSDGIVLALRMPVPAPILADERLFEHNGDVVPVERT